MPFVRLTEAEIEKVLSQSGMVLIGDVKWVRSATRCDYAISRIKVAHEEDGDLAMILSVSLSLPIPRQSFSLLYRGYPVKRLDVNGRPHRNQCRDRKRFAWVTHKHVFTDECDMEWAYAPDDITTDDLKGSFLEFCKECNIRFDGKWHPATVGLGL